MANENLHHAKTAKNDEFYTQYADIQKEINAYLEYDATVFKDKTILLPCDDPEWSNFTKFFAQNFVNFGLKKLISTSYAVESKRIKWDWQPTLFETENPLFDVDKTKVKGKIFTLTADENKDGKIDINDLQWHYMDGDGDFRSEEVKKLRDKADIIITNPPFSLFREFLAWIVEADKKFLIIANMNAITYKEVFPLIKDNKLWLGATGNGTDMVFGVPEGAEVKEHDRQKAARLGYIGNYTRLGNSCWFTNLDHGRRHQPLKLMTMADNIKFNKKLKGQSYQKYDNYNAIEVPFTDAIPSDYRADMGVPISFLDKYCPEQFEIVKFRKGNDGKDLTYSIHSSQFFRTEQNRTEQNRTEQNRTEQNRTEQNSYPIFQNHRQAQDVTALWESPSASSINTAPNNLKSSDLTGMSPIIQTTDTVSPYQDEKPTPESSSATYCNGVMGVPISFLDKYCPEQFEILWTTDRGGDGQLDEFKKPHSRYDAPVINGQGIYKRIFIRHK